MTAADQVQGAPLRSVGRRRRTLADLAYDELIDAIVYRRLQPGQALGLDQLAAQLGMSRTPVNLALSRLHADGLVSYVEHTGFVVRVLDATELAEIFDLRLMCELHAAATGLPTAPPAALDGIAEIQDRIASSTDWAEPEAFRRFWDLDGQFHRAIVRLSPNDQLQEWFGRLNHHVHGARLGLLAPRPGPFHQMLEEHAAIVAALLERNVPAVQEALRRHILRSRDVSLERLVAVTSGEAVADPAVAGTGA